MARNPSGPLYDFSPQPTLLVQPDGFLLAANLAAAQLFGYPQNFFPGKTLREITLNPDDELSRLIATWQSSSKFLPASLAFCLDGSRIDCHVEGGMSFLDSHKACIVLRLFANPSRPVEHELREVPPRPRSLVISERHKEWGRAILANIGEGVLATNGADQITFMNPMAEDLTGWKEAEAVGLSVRIVFPIWKPPMLEFLGAADMRDGDSEPDLRNRELLVSRHGKETPIVKRMTLLRDTEGAVSGAVVVFRDVTEQLRAADDQKRLMDELRLANEGLKQFAFSASHDLQEPLRMIAIYSQLLSRKLAPERDPETAEYLRYTIEGARRMEALVRGLLAFTEAGAPDAAGPFEPVDCKAALDVALEAMHATLDQSGAQIVAGPLPVVRAHHTNVVQLFQNLVGNSVKYRGGALPRIEISAERHEREWEFSVSDNGIGIPAQYHVHVFGVFKRLQAHSWALGTGMGLAICKRIVDRYNGKIWVDSSEGEGSTFYFTIPDFVSSGIACGSRP